MLSSSKSNVVIATKIHRKARIVAKWRPDLTSVRL